MLRFTAPPPLLPLQEQKEVLREQFDIFMRSDALHELFNILRVDRGEFVRRYNGRQTPDGGVREMMELEPLEDLENYREEIYPLLRELGFMDINKPLHKENSHILVLGGTLNACYCRTRYAAQFITPSTRYVDGLSCYRPINPTEREGTSFPASCETEFGAISESFTTVFSLDAGTSSFCGDRNLNRISCVKSFCDPGNKRIYRVFAAPSTQPDIRRADTGDSLLFYLNETSPNPTDSLLAITHNRHCNRQFVQLAYLLMKQERPLSLDVIGCVPDERLTTCEQYDPFQFLQDLIGLLDWIERFERDL